MAEASSAHRAATATHEETSPQRAGRRRRTSADPQRAWQGATAAAVAAPAALDSLSRLQQLADASPQVAQLRRLQALADGYYAPVAQLAGGPEEEELVQGKFATAELQPQLQQAPRANNTGLPDQLKSGIESLSGLSMDEVRVHYNSAQPAQLNALAYAQGSDIHLAPGEEQHLPHEAWHVVQRAQGRVQPTMQMKNGVLVNDDAGLEHEADVMGAKAMQMRRSDPVITCPSVQAMTVEQRTAKLVEASESTGGDSGTGGEKVHVQFLSTPEIARAGHSAGSQILPHAEPILCSFGRHDIGDVKARVGSVVTTASATGVSDALDSAGGHADAVADTVVAGCSAEPLLDGYEGESVGTAPVLRKIKKGSTWYPATWKQLVKLPNDKLPNDAQSAANEVMDAVRKQLSSPIIVDKLYAAWNKVAKHLLCEFDVDGEREQLVDAIRKCYNRSINAQKSYLKRDNEAQLLTEALQNEDSEFSFQPSARNPMLVHKPMEEIDYDPNTLREQRAATHMSTVILSQHPKGIEAQGSLSRTGQDLFASLNINSTNEALRLQLKVAEDVKKMSAELLIARNIGSMSRKAAMDDVVVRHALKLYDRLGNYVAADAPVTIPPPVAIELDGLHAEIRIEQTNTWDESTHFPPTGTKYPCMGCYLYFSRQKIEIGKWMGPMWVTNSALTTQLQDLLSHKKLIGSMGSDNVKKVSERLAEDYRGHAKPKGVRMGQGKIKSGLTTLDRQADSDSEYDEEDYAQLQQRIKMYSQGTPMSPTWKGRSTWVPSGVSPLQVSDSPSRMSHWQSMSSEFDRPGKKLRTEDSVHSEDESKEEQSMNNEDHFNGFSTFGSGSQHSLSTPQSQIDVFSVNGTSYAANDPHIRQSGECLWDVLRHYGIGEQDLAHAAMLAGLTVNAHVMHDEVWPLIQQISQVTGQSYSLVLDIFSIDGTPIRQDKMGSGETLFIGMMVDPSMQGHYVPKWEK